MTMARLLLPAVAAALLFAPRATARLCSPPVAVALLPLPTAIATDPLPLLVAVVEPLWTMVLPPIDILMFGPELLDVESACAVAIPVVVAIPEPTPKTTAKAPTRPM